jgi:hypothetical protein
MRVRHAEPHEFVIAETKLSASFRTLQGPERVNQKTVHDVQSTLLYIRIRSGAIQAGSESVTIDWVNCSHSRGHATGFSDLTLLIFTLCIVLNSLAVAPLL